MKNLHLPGSHDFHILLHGSNLMEPWQRAS
jgi:hypothetical protein